MSFANAKQQIHLRAVSTSRAEPALIRLAERDQFSPRLRDVLQALLDLCTCELKLRVSETLTEFEKQLVRRGFHAPTSSVLSRRDQLQVMESPWRSRGGSRRRPICGIARR